MFTSNSLKNININGVNNKEYYKSSPNKTGKDGHFITRVDNETVKIT